MTLIGWVLVAFASLLGLVIGSFLNVVIARVPAGEALTEPSHCRACGLRITPWQNVPLLSWLVLRGRCASCGERISFRYPAVEALTALVFGAIAAGVILVSPQAGLHPASAALTFTAYAYFAAVSIALLCIDLDTQRLPNSLTLPSYPVLLVLLAATAWLSDRMDMLLRAVIGGLVLWAFYGAIRLLRADAMGGGDVKLAGLIGIMLAYLGWAQLVVGGFAAFVFGGIFGIFLLAFSKAHRKSRVPFGPWMILGAWVGIIFGAPIATWYLDLFLT